MSHILFVLTAADHIALTDGSLHPTGFWAEEFVVSHRELRAAGHDISIVTPGGRPAPVDPGSLSADAVGAESAAQFAEYISSVRDQLDNPGRLEDVDVSEFAAVVFPGGHGPMVDLAFDESLGNLLVRADEADVLIAPFCHGPAALLSATLPDGSFAFAGRRMAAFTDEEERQGGVQNMPWLLSSRLSEQGAVLDAGSPWSSHAVIDGNLISGQNPQSSAAVAAAVRDALAS